MCNFYFLTKNITTVEYNNESSINMKKTKDKTKIPNIYCLYIFFNNNIWGIDVAFQACHKLLYELDQNKKDFL